MPTGDLYDAIGIDYANLRRPDPRIGAAIWAAVGDAGRILNVGAGAGSYEDPERNMTAVEPSAVMLRQRPADLGPAVQAGAEALPFPADTFDVALALLTVHHWTDLRQGLAELRRVSRRQVVFTFDHRVHDSLWIFRQYVPDIVGLAAAAPLEEVIDALGAQRVEIVSTPADCTDGFITAYWRRPEQFLRPEVRAATSGFSVLTTDQTQPGLDRLQRDLASGAWERDHADLLAIDTFDTGLRLVVAGH
jgi:SAM-dependent methyltransferase